MVLCMQTIDDVIQEDPSLGKTRRAKAPLRQ